MPLIFLLCALSLAVYATSTDELIAHAHTLKLSENRYWHLLLHAPHSESEIDDPAFFLASNGKTDISSELDTTITHFANDINQSDGSVFCRFPARRVWLEHELNTSFGEGACQEYNALVDKMDPKKVTLVFPSAHINSPASMFGHTFLRIDSSMDSKLMSYAINYAAFTDDTNGLLFAYKGVFGGYNGFYSMLPYYEKLKEYRDSESRDVWEYDLNLQPNEVLAMVRHIWELQHIHSWYYFLDENCSYNMLWLAEIARPSVHLREHFLYYVIPPETVRAFEDEKLVTSKQFRPSKRTKLLAYERTLSPQGITTVQLLAQGKIDTEAFKKIPLRDQERRFVLEAAAELVEYSYIEREITKEVYLSRYYPLLSMRSTLGTGENLSIPTKSNPDTAHRSARLTVSQGWFNTRSPLLIGVRPAFHNLSEGDTGHLLGAQIEFLDTVLGLDHNKMSVEKLTFLSLASITPTSHFFKPFSWQMKSGWDREYGNDQLTFVTRIGAGASIGNDTFFGYLLTEPEVRAGLHNDIGIGLNTGGGINWGGRMKSYLEAGHIVYWDGANRSHIMLSHLWEWSTWGALSVSYETSYQYRHDDRYKVGINLYF